MKTKLIAILLGFLLIGLMGVIHYSGIEHKVELAADGGRHESWKRDDCIYYERHYYPNGQLESEMRRDEHQQPLWFELWDEAGRLRARAYEKNYLLITELYDEQGNLIRREP